jgi:hypothetical protein
LALWFDSLMIKRWTHLFNLEERTFHILTSLGIDVGLSIGFLELEAFKAMGDSLGKFLHVDANLLSGQDRRIGKMMVEIDLQKGLPSSYGNRMERDCSHTETGLLGDPILLHGLQGGGAFEESMSWEIKKIVRRWLDGNIGLSTLWFWKSAMRRVLLN